MNLIFTLTYILWLLSEILLNRLLHSKSSDKQHADKNSLRLIWITIIATIFMATYISATFYFPLFFNESFRYIGLVVIFIGMLLRLLVVKSLGVFFTVDVTIRQNHKLKKDGFYKFLRHPSYFASLLSFVGYGITLNNWVALLLIVVAIIAVFTIRIKIEEKVLIEQFGSEYLAYKKTTSGFIPFVY